MAIYTILSPEELDLIYEQFQLSSNSHCEPISEGTQNSNYLLTDGVNKYVLTVLEHGNISDLILTLQLSQALLNEGLPVAKVYPTIGGDYFFELHDKPIVLSEFIEGEHFEQLNEKQLQQVGTFLAKLHSLSIKVFSRTNKRDHQWQQQVVNTHNNDFSLDEKNLLEEINHCLDDYDFSYLPHSVTHSDLFRDNLIFQGSELKAVIDLYDTAYDSSLYDLAVAVNDCCKHDDPQIQAQNIETLLKAYQAIRPLTDTEQKSWLAMRIKAASVFWLLRLSRWYDPNRESLNNLKDPNEYANLIRNLLNHMQ